MNHSNMKDNLIKIFLPIESLLKKIIIVLGIMLFVSQLLLLFPQTRQYVSPIDRLEGKPLTEMEAIPVSMDKATPYSLELLLLEDIPRNEVAVYLNDKKVASFEESIVKIPIVETGDLTIKVNGIPGIYSIQILDIHTNDSIIDVPGKVIEVSQDSSYTIPVTTIR